MAERDLSAGTLFNNGAVDPRQWAPPYDNCRSVTNVDVGDLVGWRYGGWRVIEVRPIEDVDLSDEQRQRLAGYKPEVREQYRPRHTVLRHEVGPLILLEGERTQRLHDGSQTVSMTRRSGSWVLVPEPYMACSCHGHIWPCQEIDQAAMAARAAKSMDRAMATTEPGVCANCLEVITTRQKTVTFPEESRLVPGAPGPTFHAGRGACWAEAEKYERTGRLQDNPDVARLASCPGVRFIHEARDMPTHLRVECTAEGMCTGYHGPPGYHREAPCWHVMVYASGEGAFARPPTDCGYRAGELGCLGRHIGGGSTVSNEIAGDLFWDLRWPSQ